jgi:hypothetical protein
LNLAVALSDTDGALAPTALERTPPLVAFALLMKVLTTLPEPSLFSSHFFDLALYASEYLGSFAMSASRVPTLKLEPVT